jgi:hypothetical protein
LRRGEHFEDGRGPARGGRRRTRSSRLILWATAIALLTFAIPLFATSATAATASWSVEPTTWNFGARVPEEGFSEPHEFVLNNTGSVALEPALITLIPGAREGGEFRFKGEGCHVLLPPGGSCPIKVEFRATGAGPATASLEVSERNSLVGPAVAIIDGSGGTPSVEVSPSTLDFGMITLPYGAALTHGSSRTVTVANVGSADLIIREDTFEEGGISPPRPNFSLNRPSLGPGGCLRSPYATVAPGGSCVIELEFEPRNPGSYQAQIQLHDNAPDSPQTISLQGTASAEAAPQIVRDTSPPAAPQMTRKPSRRTKRRGTTFAFSGDSTTVGFQCQLGAGPLLGRCRSPVHFGSLKPGRHLFRVRAIGGDGMPGPVVTYRWRILK